MSNDQPFSPEAIWERFAQEQQEQRIATVSNETPFSPEAVRERVAQQRIQDAKDRLERREQRELDRYNAEETQRRQWRFSVAKFMALRKEPRKAWLLRK